MTLARSRPKALAALVLLAVIWGYNWVLMKVAVRYAPPFDFAAMRVFYGALSLFVVLWLQGRSMKLQRGAGTLGYGLLQSGGTIGLSTWALVSGGAGKTAVLTYTMSFWTLLFAWLLLGETLRLRQWASLGVAAAGLLFVVLPIDIEQAPVSKGLAILAGIAWALASILLKRIDHGETIDPLRFTAWQMLFGSLPLIAVSWLTPSAPVEWTPAFILVLLYNIGPGSAVAWLLWLYALRHLSTSLSSLGALLTPTLSIAMAALQLGEVPKGTELLGMVLILCALALSIPNLPRAISRRHL